MIFLGPFQSHVAFFEPLKVLLQKDLKIKKILLAPNQHQTTT